MDLSSLSDADLAALSKNDLSSVSDQGLHTIHAQASAAPSAPAPISKTDSALTGVVQGATLGFGDEISGGMEALGRAAGVNGLGKSIDDMEANPDGGTLDFAKLKDAYVKGRDSARSNNSAAQAANPWSYGTGEFVGSVPAMGASGSVGLGLPAIGAVQGLGASNADLTKGEFGQAAADTGKGALYAYLAGKAGDYAGKAISSTVSKIPAAAQTIAGKVGKAFAGVPEEATQAYIDAGGDIVARPKTEILDELSGLSNDSADQLNTAKTNVADSQSGVDQIEQDHRNNLQDSKFDTRSDIQDTRQNVNDAVQMNRQTLQDSNLMKLKQPISDDIDQLKSLVTSGSSKAYDILSKEAGTIPTAPLVDQLQSGMQSLTINGVPVSDSAAASYGALEKLHNRLATVGEISFPQAKQILQQLDNDGIFAASKASFSPEADSIKAGLRYTLDTTVKDAVPAYADQMETVADQTRLLQQLQNGFGSDSKIIARLNNMASEKGRDVDFGLLKQLGDNTGTDYETPINKYISDKDTLANPIAMDQFKAELPQSSRLVDLQSKYAQLADPATARSAPQLPEYQAAQSKLNDAQAALEAAQQRNAVMGKLNPATVESKFNAMNGTRTYGADDLMGKVDAMTGKDYSTEIRNRGVLDSFGKGDTNGSRKVVAMGDALGAGGAAIGGIFAGAPGAGVGYIAGKAVGSTAGLFLDKSAGELFQNALDTGMGIGKFADKLGPYAATLNAAAQRGTQALAATHYILQQRDADYRKRVSAITGSGD